MTTRKDLEARISGALTVHNNNGPAWGSRCQCGEDYPCTTRRILEGREGGPMTTDPFTTAAQEPSDAEVEAVADVLEALDGMDFQEVARAALSSARAARRDEEKR